MAESISWSRQQLRYILVQYFDEEELRDLCFDLNVDYDSLPARGKAGKARELVLQMNRASHVKELREAVICKRPGLPSEPSPIGPGEPPPAGPGEPPPIGPDWLYKQLEAWKKVHSALQDLQIDFKDCRGYILALGELKDLAQSVQLQEDRILRDVNVYWQSCKHSFDKLEDSVANIQTKGWPFEEHSTSVPDLFFQLWEKQAEVNAARSEGNVSTLTDHLLAFGDKIDWLLYRVDQALSRVVDKLNQL